MGSDFRGAGVMRGHCPKTAFGWEGQAVMLSNLLILGLYGVMLWVLVTQMGGYLGPLVWPVAGLLALTLLLAMQETFFQAPRS